MGKESRNKLLITATVSFILLLPWLYALTFGENFIESLDLWRNQISDWTIGGSTMRYNGTDNLVMGNEGGDSVTPLLSRLVRGKDRTELEKTGFSCDISLNSKVCVSRDPVRIDTRTMTIYLSSNQDLPHINTTVQPYALQRDATAMSLVKQVFILRDEKTMTPPPCDITHDVSAVVFSTGGFSGNMFHEFNDIIIPLFLTTHYLQSNVQFMIVDFKPWFVTRYHRILTHLSRHNAINSAEDGKVHCYPEAVIGLRYHDNLACNSSEIPGGYSMDDFRRFLRHSYSLNISNAAEAKKPVLVLISRRKTRVFLNENEIVGLAKDLGYEVVIATTTGMWSLDKFSAEINSCSVLVGVHGAGITNAVFMAEGTVLVQVVPLGLQWPSTAYFGDPVREMNVHYLEYRINPEESSLLEKYGRDDPAISDPMSIHKQGYYASRAMYVDGQNIRLDLVRFNATLVEAMELLRK